jgi:RNA polymerase sigma factor (sigma-70 family)
VDEATFRALLGRVRASDADAAAQLIRAHEAAIRRYARLHLTDPRLRRLLDATDVCQSVLGEFFARAALGQFDLDRPGQLFKLLATMARNKILNHARAQRAARRDQRRVQAGDGALRNVAGPEAAPERVVAGRELLQEVRRRLTEDERDLADQRVLGRGWAELAAERGTSPEALRKRYARALDRVGQEVGIEEASCG